MTTRETIIIDADPGQDDAVAILLALAAHERLELRGITAVAGNVGVDLTAANALRIVELGGRADMPVYRGAGQPLLALDTAEFVCGVDGLAGANSRRRPDSRKPSTRSFYHPRCAAPDGHHACPLGPLTNIALALRLAPDIVPKIKRIVLMGGAMNLGNITPAAEYNVYVDPHAAGIVFASGIPIVMMGLHLTHQAICSHDEVDRIGKLGTTIGRAIYGMLTRPRAARLGTSGHPMHDPCVIAYLLWPELFEGRDCFVEVETSAGPLRGRTTIDWNGRLQRPANALVMDKVNAPEMFRRMIDLIAQLP